MHTTEDGPAVDDPGRGTGPGGAPGGPTGDGDRTAAPVEVVAVGVVAVLAGAVLRFATTSSLWLDEALTVNISRLGPGDLFEALRHDGHPPLYYLLLHWWMELFGTGDHAVRALSGVFGLLTIPLAWIAGRRRGGPLLGWITVTFVALSPFAVRYSDEARMYSLVMLLTFAGYLLVDDVLRRGRDDWWRLGAIAVVAAALLYSHYWALWLLAAAGLMALWQAWRAPSGAERAPALRVVGALVVGGLLFVPWLPTMLYQSAHTGTPWADPTRPTVAVGYTLADYGSGIYADAVFFGMLLFVLLLLGVFGRARDGAHIDLDLRTNPHLRVEAVAGALTFVIGICLAYVLRGAYSSRYSAVVFPFVAVLIAGGVTRFTARWVRFGALVVLAGILGIGALANIGDGRTQAPRWAEAIDATANPGDVVVYCPDQLGPAGSRAVTADVEQLVYPTFGDARFVDWVDYKERNEAADPEAFARELVARAGPSHAVYVVWNGAYKTLEDDCEDLVNAVGAARPGQELVTEEGRYFEKGYVTWFPAAS